jgi:hypothetical protein
VDAEVRDFLIWLHDAVMVDSAALSRHNATRAIIPVLLELGSVTLSPGISPALLPSWSQGNASHQELDRHLSA